MEQVADRGRPGVHMRRALDLVMRVGAFDWLLLYPLLITAALVLAGNDGFGFDSPGWLDSYVYLGYFWHYPEHLWLFDDNSNYKISRLPWILPGAIAHRLLPPVAAAHVLAFCALASAAVALYLHLRDVIEDRHAAAFISVVLACCTWMHGPGGWYYHALAAAGFYLWSCWMVTRAATSRHAIAWGKAAGACYAAAVHTHLFLAVFAPLLVLLYWAALERRGTGSSGSRWLVAAVSAMAGGLALTAILAIINRATGGQWLFFMPQVEQALKVSGDKYWSPAAHWLPGATHLVLPMAMIALGLTSFRRPWRAGQRLAGMLVLLPCIALGVMCFLQVVMHQTTLDYPYMAFPLYLHAFGAAAIAVRQPGNSVRRLQPLLLAAGSALIVVPLFLLLPLEPKAWMGRLAGQLGLAQAPAIVPPLVLCLIGVLAARMTPRRLRLVVVAIWLSLVNAWIAPQPSAYGRGTAGIRQPMLDTFREADAFTHRLDPTMIGIKYWMSSEDLPTPQGPVRSQDVFDSYLATRAWLTNLFARASPGLPMETLTLGHLSAATCVGILSSHESQAALSQAMMAHYASLGRPLVVLAEHQFQRADFGFALTVLKPADTAAAAATSGSPPACLTIR
jgi:hypothetical protein